MKVLFSALFFLLIYTVSAGHIPRGKLSYGTRGVLRPVRRASLHVRHSVTFASKLKNADRLEQILYDVSDPDSPNYGKHWTSAQLGSFLQNEEGSRRLREYLVREGVTIISATPYDELITAEASIGTWERVFGTEFHEFVHEDWKGSVMNRALEYSFSEEINEYVESVFEVADFPALIAAHPVVDKLSGASPNPYPSRVSPSFLLNHYDIDPSIGNSKFGSQAILSCIGQVLSPADLSLHQSIFGLPNTRLTNWTGGHVDDDACKKTITNCDEANLDVQYITAVGQNLPTYNYYDEKCDWLGVVKFLASLHNPPTVLSISYSSYETDVGSSLVSSFNNIAQQLGIQGVTLFAASGDDGVSGFQTARKADCAYNPQFPASSPYVTSVGATQGPESNSPEVACQANTGGVITTGGGFSKYSSVPPWQSAAVSGYFKGLDNLPTPGYSNGRGYPDVSALGKSYMIVANRTIYLASGTSASSPVIAGMFSLINSARLAGGKPVMGFLNPFLYSKEAAVIFKDIVFGNNRCTRYSSLCCSQGFSASNGWDPLTGLGAINFTRLAYVAAPRPVRSPTPFPTVSPDSPENELSMKVEQTILGVKLDDFETNFDLYVDTLREAFAQTMTFSHNVVLKYVKATSLDSSKKSDDDLYEDSVTRLFIRGASPAVETWIADTAVVGITLGYIAVFTSTQTIDYYTNLLKATVNNGQFTDTLRQVAYAKGAIGFQNAYAESVAAAEYNGEEEDHDGSTFTTTYLIIVIVGSSVLICVIFCTIYCFIWGGMNRRRSRSRLPPAPPAYTGARPGYARSSSSSAGRYRLAPSDVKISDPSAPVIAEVTILPESGDDKGNLTNALSVEVVPVEIQNL